MTTIVLCLLALAEVPHATMPEEFLGEPQTIDQMRIGDSYWVPADCLVVDEDAKCWLDPQQRLDEKSIHRIKVERKKIGGDVVYIIYVYKDWLMGWRWKKTKLERKDMIPVASLSANLK